MSVSDTSTKDVLWVVTVDGKQARFYEHREEDRIVPAGTSGPGQYSHKKEVMASVLEPLPELALKAEPGAAYQAPRHTRTPHGDFHEEIKEKFMRDVAAHLEQASIGSRFTRLVLAAPPRLLGALRALLNPHIRKKLAAELDEELTHLPPHELLAHLKRQLPDVFKS